MAGDSLRDAARAAGITALAIDAIYTTVWWLILGRNERRLKKHAALRYFAIIFQLAAETAAIIHLAGMLRKVEETKPAEVTELRVA